MMTHDERMFDLLDFFIGGGFPDFYYPKKENPYPSKIIDEALELGYVSYEAACHAGSITITEPGRDAYDKLCDEIYGGK